MEKIGRLVGRGPPDRARGAAETASAQRYQFFVDRVTQTEISGWAADTADLNRRLTLQFRIDGVAVGVADTDLPRADVEKAGRGGPRCGFKWLVPPEAARRAVEMNTPIEIAVSDRAPHVLGKVQITTHPVVNRDVRENMRPLLERVIADAALLTIADDNRPVRRHEPGRYLLHDRLFAARVQAGQPQPVSPYITFNQKRLRQEVRLPLDGSDRAKDALLRWYIDAYAQMRKPMRVPLGATEIAHLNEPVALPGIPYKISRASLGYALAGEWAKALMPVHDEATYDAFVIWWSTGIAPELNVEDCLVPDYYVDQLRRVTTSWQGKPMAPSAYLVHRLDHQETFPGLDRYHEQDRVVLYVWYLLGAAAKPALIRYLPTMAINALFEGASGSTLFDKILQSVHPSGDELSTVFNAQTFSDLLYRRGFDLARRRFIYRDAKGNRFHAAGKPPARTPWRERTSLQVIGPFEKSSGLGQASRLSMQTLRCSRYQANFVDFPLDNPAPVGLNAATGSYASAEQAKVNIIHLNGETLPTAFAYLPDVFNGAYNIGYFFWELSTPAPAQALAIDLIDEIWVASEYGVSIYAPATDKPVTNVGMAFEPVSEPGKEEARAWLRERYTVAENTFVFLAAFDSFSFVERKNPHGTVAAFREAFGEDDDVRLILKTHSRDFVNDPYQIGKWDRIEEIAACDPRIILINETLRFADLIKLKKASDCFVSLHRSEGWGFGVIEAMSIGVPVLLTGYSGTADFATKDTAFLVDYTLI